MIKSLVINNFLSSKWMMPFFLFVCFLNLLTKGISVHTNVVMFSMILYSSYDIDVRYKFHKTLFSMPISKKNYIFSKLLYISIFIIINITVVFITLLNKYSFPMLIFISIVMLCLNFWSAITCFIFLIKLKKIGYIISLAIISIPFAIINMAIFTRKLLFLSKSFIFITLLTIILLIITIFLIKLSINILEKKEF